MRDSDKPTGLSTRRPRILGIRPTQLPGNHLPDCAVQHHLGAMQNDPSAEAPAAGDATGDPGLSPDAGSTRPLPGRPPTRVDSRPGRRLCAPRLRCSGSSPLPGRPARRARGSPGGNTVMTPKVPLLRVLRTQTARKPARTGAISLRVEIGLGPSCDPAFHQDLPWGTACSTEERARLVRTRRIRHSGRGTS